MVGAAARISSEAATVSRLLQSRKFWALRWYIVLVIARGMLLDAQVLG
jgi:hypothetical protein